MIPTSQLKMVSAHATVTAVLPVFVTVMLPVLLGDPTVAVKANVDGEMLKPVAAATGLMVRVTEMVLAVAPGADTVTVVE